MEEILKFLDKLLSTEDDTNLKRNFYQKLCGHKFANKNEEKYLFEYVLPIIYTLYNKSIIQKDNVYLTLIAYNNFDILQKCTKYDKSIHKLNISCAESLYDYCVFKKQHWFYRFLKNYECNDIFNKIIHNKILTLKLIEITNLSEVDVEQLKILLQQINTEDLDDLWKHYVKEIVYLVEIFYFCKTKVTNIQIDDFFSYASKNSGLDILSKYLSFYNIKWDEILQMLHREEDLYENRYQQSENFQAFTILGNIFQLIRSGNSNLNLNVNYMIEEIKKKLLNITSRTLQITLLENIFVIIFTKNCFLGNLNIMEGYISREKEIRLILHLLKLIIDEITIKNIYTKDSYECSRFMSLNKHVADAIWRIELVANVKDPTKCELNILKYMLASPQSLMQMCLKKGDFKRAYQVIEIFSLDDRFTTSQIRYTEALKNLRDNLKRSFKAKAYHKTNPNMSLSNIELAVDKIINDFIKTNPIIHDKEQEEIIADLSKEYELFAHFKVEGEIFMNLLDLTISQPKHYEDCGDLLQLVFQNDILNHNISSSYGKFYKKLLELYNCIGSKERLTLGEILLAPSFLNFNRYKKEEEFDIKLAETYSDFNNSLKINEDGILDSNHLSHKILQKLNTLCNDHVDWKLGTPDNVKYLSKLYSYLKAFSKILYIEQDTSDIISKGKYSSFFDILYHNRSELMGKLLFERHLDPSEFEKYFGKLKLDYLYHVIGNCFPTINLHTQENVTKEELYPENCLYIPSTSIITYIQKRNWLLAFLLNEIYRVEGVNIDISEIRIQAFLSYMKLAKIQNLKVLFDNNEIVTALQNEISTQKVSEYLNKQILNSECLVSSNYSHNSNESLETGEEIGEDGLKSTNWKELFDVIDNIPESQLKKNSVFLELKDMILVSIVQDGFETDYFKFVQVIHDRDLRICTILFNMKDWPDQFCINVIKSEITKFDSTNTSKIVDLKMWLQQIELCKEIREILDKTSWFQTFEICRSKPGEVIIKLLEHEKINLLLDFINIHKPKEGLLLKVDQNYLLKLFDTFAPPDHIKMLLDHLPYNHSINICYSLLKLLKKIDSLQFVVEYLLTNVKDDYLLQNIKLSLKILSEFTQSEQEQLLCLIYEPINIIETLVMNTKLDKLSVILDTLKSELPTTEIMEDKLSVETIDEVLRNYAEKSLDFRIITQPNPRLLRTPECKLMQSIDSLNLITSDRGFIMPEEVPTKDEWVPNNEVLGCMCCQQVMFSMFNRRHHCRRCGRVVCYSCSLHRMLVPSYGDILVRVCLDCYEQTMGDGTISEINDTISSKSMLHDYWLLTDDPEHNKIVREEFSYEHAPSVSLCLSIMKYHSKNIEYPRFLLDQCNIMLKLLQPSQEPVQEIDYLLVIKMLKSLAIAAKMSSVECTLNYGTSLADRILSQADLLSLLAERGCLSLLPVSGTHQCPYIDASVLRKLRDRLLEREQWNLALEMSTKAGLDVTGVFAAWGKSCLKAGSLLVAREKLQRCLDKSGNYETMSDCNSQSDFDENNDNFNKPKYVTKGSNLMSEAKPTKNPPLLNEIIYILESETVEIDSDVEKKIETQKLSSSMLSLSSGISSPPDAAICILNKLKNLNNISSGNYYQPTNREKLKTYPGRPSIENMFYDECIYYLTRYGSHTSLLEFFVKHGDIDLALNYIIDNQLSTDIFTDIYMRCLKDGIISILQEHMSKIDSTLDVWKNYLSYICRHLEKQQMLHCLYQLQQFMGDYIRAAMTCIRFYQENAQNFTDLAANVKFLHQAEEHLKHVLEQDQWVDVATVRRLSSSSGESFEAKGLTNPSLVMKMSSNEIDKHINTIWRQKEVVDFFAECEKFEVKPMNILANIVPSEESTPHTSERKLKIPTLFGTTQEKLHLAVLAIICGKNVEDGFDIALRIIEDFKLKPVKVYCEAGKQLAKVERYNGIGQLVSCIKHSGINDNVVRDMCDEMLGLAVATLTKANVSGTKVEDLIKLISDRASKVSAYIEAKQLKTAYFLAVKYKRMSDIRRILREAELLNQPSIKTLCQKVLQSHSHSPSHPRDN